MQAVEQAIVDVLIVDDDKDIRQSLADLLEDEGYTVARAEHGQAALEFLRAQTQAPKLILLDLNMPVMTGWEFREAQLQDPSLADIPVVVISAGTYLNRPPHIQAHAYIAKPPDVNALFALVERYCA